MKVSATDIGLFSINTYDSILSFDNVYVSGIDQEVTDCIYILEGEKKPIPENLCVPDYQYDGSKYVTTLGELACKHTKPIIQSAIKEIGFITGFTYAGGYSPKEYNFMGDDWDIDLDYCIGEFSVKDWVEKQDKAELEKYLLDNYSSRDGFTSFITNTIDGLLSEYDSYKILVVILKFEILKIINDDIEAYEELMQEFHMDVMHMDMHDFLTEDASKKFTELFDITSKLI